MSGEQVRVRVGGQQEASRLGPELADMRFFILPGMVHQQPLNWATQIAHSARRRPGARWACPDLTDISDVRTAVLGRMSWIMESMGKRRPRPRREFTPEHKAEIVELCQRGDRSVRQPVLESVAGVFRPWQAVDRHRLLSAGRPHLTLTGRGPGDRMRADAARAFIPV